MADESEKLLFRMQHIIPRNLSAIKKLKETPTTSTTIPQEIEVQMTWGKIAAKVWGPLDGRPVYALHGWLDNAGTFDKLIPLLPQDLRIVAVDTAGHGLTDHFPPDIAYNYYDSLVAIERFARLLNWEKFSIIAHSMGVAMGMMYAGVFPEKVDKLVCLDLARPPVTIPKMIANRLRKTVGKLLKYESAILTGPERPMTYEEALQRNISGSFGSLDKNACDILFKRGLKEVDGGYVFRRDRRLMAAPLTLQPKDDMLMLAKEVTADVLFIKFAQGPEFESRENFMEHVETLKTKSRSVRYCEVEGMHHTHLTHPERIAPIISEFFNASPNSTTTPSISATK